MSREGWEEGQDFDPWNTGFGNTYEEGTYWHRPDDPRVAVVRGKDALEGRYVLMADHEETAEDDELESDLADIPGGPFTSLEEAQRIAEEFLNNHP